DVCDGITVPAFREHAHTDDTAHIASWRVERTTEFLRQCLKPFRIEWASLSIPLPIHLPYRVQGETHPLRFVAFGFTRIGFMDYFGIDPDGVLLTVLVAKVRNMDGRNPCGCLIFCQPLIDHLGNPGVLTDQNKHRGTRVVA